MRTSTRLSRAGGPLAVTLALVLGGCGSPEAGSGSAVPKQPQHRTARVVDPTQRAPVDMVAAVSASKGPPLEMRFEPRQRPQAGQPVDIDVIVVPTVPSVERIYGHFQAGEGLELLAGADLPQAENPAQDVPIRHTLRVMPRQDGIFAISAVVEVDSANQALNRAFSIPLIVGDGIPELTAPPATAAANEGGDRTEPATH